MDSTEINEFKTVISSPTCLIHFENEDGPLTCFTDTSFGKFLTSHEHWITLDGPQRDIAERTSDIVANIRSLEKPVNIIQNLHYHTKCYSRFTNITSIKRAQSRCSKQLATVEAEDSNVEETESHHFPPPKKVLRSDNLNSFKSRNKNILPPVCLICQKQNTYITDQVSTCFFCANFSSI